ncbi:uncharacterized protein UV8b_00368 [Ustilaginoidea virens]|uniref:Uncharacterized protein n=1 Tax=Ustilaginoidea virens TaxID=1159556 RepID=A0A8E5ME11_USTVR|nr:uncharacterized protein UV8b_00368 [Ustilaginoidea virens]QUC16127.1 hypothetical protein UV8b_00368 [Ustilaginoidea virens]
MEQDDDDDDDDDQVTKQSVSSAQSPCSCSPYFSSSTPEILACPPQPPRLEPDPLAPRLARLDPRVNPPAGAGATCGKAGAPVHGEQSIPTAVLQTPRVEARRRIEALQLLVGVDEAGVVEGVPQDVLGIRQVDAVPAVGVAGAQGKISTARPLLDRLAGGDVKQSKAACAGGDGGIAAEDHARRGGEQRDKQAEHHDWEEAVLTRRDCCRSMNEARHGVFLAQSLFYTAAKEAVGRQMCGKSENEKQSEPPSQVLRGETSNELPPTEARRIIYRCQYISCSWDGSRHQLVVVVTCSLPLSGW